MSQIDRAKEEVERIAAEMRKGAENLSKGLPFFTVMLLYLL
jgi:hypothetical protein